MSPLRSCSICGRATPKGNRCEQHAHKPRSGSYSRAAAKVRAEAEWCWICGEPFLDLADPPIADHVVPRMYGGSDDKSNLRAAHRSCNGRRGARLARG